MEEAAHVKGMKDDHSHRFTCFILTCSTSVRAAAAKTTVHPIVTERRDIFNVEKDMEKDDRQQK